MIPERPTSLGRRLLPAVMLTGAAGVMLLSLDRPTGHGAADASSADDGVTALPEPDSDESSSGSAAVDSAEDDSSTAGSSTARSSTARSSTAGFSTVDSSVVAGAADTDESAAVSSSDESEDGEVVSSPAPATTQSESSVDSTPTTPTTSTATEVADSEPTACTGTAYAGPTIDTKWGPVQVTATVSASGVICSVDTLVTPDDHSKSIRINDRAVPVLNDEVLAEQSADIDVVSGATITWRAYRQSLQAILDEVSA